MNEWPGMNDLAMLLEPYGIDVKDIAVQGGLEIQWNPMQRPDGPAFALTVTTIDRDPTGSPYLRDGEKAVSKRSIPLSMLPGLTPRT